MQKLFVLLAAVACASAAVVVPHTNFVSVAPSTRRDRNVRPLALSGTWNCGIGDIHDVRLAGCSSAPCELRRGQNYNIQVDFAPTGNRDFGTVFFKSLVLKDNQIQTITEDVHMPNVHLYPGVQYTLNWDFTIPSAGFTGDSELRLKVFQNLFKPLCLVIRANLQ